MNTQREMLENKGKDFNEFGLEDFKELDIPERVSKTEAIIFNWVTEHFGITEAMNPSWNISALADEIDAQQQNPKYTPEYTVAYADKFSRV